jgi:hypothetical protein
MSPAKREPREMKLNEIAANFDVAGASYWWEFGGRRRWCPAVYRNDGGDYRIRYVKSVDISAGNGTSRVTYDYFELDADGLITVAPWGFAREYKPGRVVDIAAEAERYATPDPDAARIGLPR